jgi:hypothetical protein
MQTPHKANKGSVLCAAKERRETLAPPLQLPATKLPL